MFLDVNLDRQSPLLASVLDLEFDNRIVDGQIRTQHLCQVNFK